MAYPSLEQYNEALQAPQFALLDPQLKHGTLKKSGLGLPLALCGGFALTYTMDLPGKRLALRCFHKESRELQRRYQAVSERLKQLSSPYFLPFEFVASGIKIQGATYPIVKMDWAQGSTLAEFLETKHRDTQALTRLRQSLKQLAAYLEQQQIAHGDIQPENLMISGDGSAIQLIDYDGMFVSALRGSKATELGQINFQHPDRSDGEFHERLDRFSFLTLDVALQALIASPGLWKASSSEPSAVVFRRNDFLDPGSSRVFQDAIKLAGVKMHAENLARVATGEFGNIPALADFLLNKNIPGVQIVFKATATPSIAGYQGVYPVCDATNYAQVLALVGNRVEMIGRIHSVKRGWAANRKPYVFVNFSDWRGKAVKLAIWVDGLDALKPNVPDDSWVGRWVSVNGLVDPPFEGQVRSTRYTHLSITVSAASQIHTLTEAEAQFRLRGAGRRPAASATTGRNVDVLRTMGGSPSNATARTPPPPPQTSNQQLLDRMRTQTPAPQRSTPPAQRPQPAQRPPASSPSKGLGLGTWIILALVGMALLRACGS